MIAVLIGALLMPTFEARLAPLDPAEHQADLRCLAVFTIAQGELRVSDPRQAPIAEALPRLRNRIDADVADTKRDEAEVMLDLQLATNASRPTFRDEIAGCLDRTKVEPAVSQTETVAASPTPGT